MSLDTYEAILDDVHFPALGSTKEEALEYLVAWLTANTDGYKLRRFYLKKRFNQQDWKGAKK